MEIYDCIKFMVATNIDQRVLLIHSSRELKAGCKEIGKRAIQYVTNRNIFKDGAYSINVDDFSSGGIMKSIREKMGSIIPANDHNALL